MGKSREILEDYSRRPYLWIIVGYLSDDRRVSKNLNTRRDLNCPKPLRSIDVLYFGLTRHSVKSSRHGHDLHTVTYVILSQQNLVRLITTTWWIFPTLLPYSTQFLKRFFGLYLFYTFTFARRESKSTISNNYTRCQPHAFWIRSRHYYPRGVCFIFPFSLLCSLIV